MKLCFSISTFNAHMYFYAISEKRCMKLCKKHEEPHRIYLTTEEKSKPRCKKTVLFSYAKL